MDNTDQLFVGIRKLTARWSKRGHFSIWYSEGCAFQWLFYKIFTQVTFSFSNDCYWNKKKPTKNTNKQTKKQTNVNNFCQYGRPTRPQLDLFVLNFAVYLSYESQCLKKSAFERVFYCWIIFALPSLSVYTNLSTL